MNGIEFEKYYKSKLDKAIKSGKIVRLLAGSYVVFRNGRIVSIERILEGDYKGYWIVRDKRPDSYSTPIKTYSEARIVALNWGD